MKISPYYLVFWIQILAFVVMEGLSIFRILEVLGSMFEFALALLRQLQPTLCQLMSPFRRDPLRGAPTLKSGAFRDRPELARVLRAWRSTHLIFREAATGLARAAL